MPGTVSLTGKDTVSINGTILNGLADGECAVLTFPNDLTLLKTGKNGNTIYSFKYDGRQCQLVLRIIRGCSDDKFLNQLLSVYKANPPAFSLLQGFIVKNVGDGSGNMISDTYTLSGGAFKRETDVKEDADGGTEQSVSIYTLVFSNAPRQIG